MLIQFNWLWNFANHNLVDHKESIACDLVLKTVPYTFPHSFFMCGETRSVCQSGLLHIHDDFCF